jgi:hypothetical protein
MPPLPTLQHALASSSRLNWLFPHGDSPACISGYCEARLLEPNPLLEKRWNAGRCAPVTLVLTLDAPTQSLGLCPDSNNAAGEGEISLIVVNEDVPQQRTGYIGPWHDGQWLDLPLPFAAERLRIEFVALKESWIALRAVRFQG